MMMTVKTSPLIEHLGIVGVGLIGGSIGAAVRQNGIASKVTGLGRSAARLAAAVKAGCIDAATEDVGQFEDCDLVVVTTPVDHIVDDILAVSRHCRPGTIITDAGSVKGSICNSIPRDAGIRFVGAHPLAGSEKSGFEHADAQLFQGRVCVLTPDDKTHSDALEAVRRFWKALGMIVHEMSPAEHDRQLARTSHLPHLVAAALSCLLYEKDRPFVASGFRDTTRIAAGDPELWRAIVAANASAIQEETGRLIQLLTKWRDYIGAEDWDQLADALRQGKDARDAIHD